MAHTLVSLVRFIFRKLTTKTRIRPTFRRCITVSGSLNIQGHSFAVKECRRQAERDAQKLTIYTNKRPIRRGMIFRVGICNQIFDSTISASSIVLVI